MNTFLVFTFLSLISASATALENNFEQLYLRGTHNNWATTNMILVQDNTWQAEVQFADSSSERFKFDVYGDWSYNFGDNNVDNWANRNEKDIAVTQGQGLYRVTFHDTDYSYSVEKLPSNQKPIAIAGDDVVVNIGEKVFLDASASYDPDGQLISYSWSNALNGEKGSQVYNNAGNYSITLTVVDDQGATATDSIEVTVLDPSMKEQIFARVYLRGTTNNWGSSAMQLVDNNVWQIDVEFAGAVDERFKFDINGDWQENYGDTNQDKVIERSGSDIYLSQGAGIYRVQLNDKSKVYTVQKLNIIPVADAGVDQTILVGQSITFDASKSTDVDGTIKSYAWSNGLNGITATKTYLSAGRYEVTLTVTDDRGASNSDVVVINVQLPENSLPTANAGEDIQINVGETAYFDASTSHDIDGSIVKYIWSKENSTSSTNATFSQLFTRGGAYTFRLTVEDDRGGVDSDELTVFVNQHPIADAGKDRTIYTNQTTILNGSNSYDPDGEIRMYYWMERATSVSIPVTYTKAGVYTENLSVFDHKGGEAYDSVIITVIDPINNKPIALIDNMPVINKVIRLGDSLTVDGGGSSDQEGAISYLWSNNERTATTTFNYSEEGVYIESLTVTDSDGAQTTALLNVEVQGLSYSDGDWDDDGIPDDWEILYGLDPLHNDAELDSDNDGLTNLQEFVLSTNPIDQDTDKDGALDGSDLYPFDTDNDGVNNAIDDDDDNDGVLDTEDAFPLDSDEQADSDGDGIGNNADSDNILGTQFYDENFALCIQEQVTLDNISDIAQLQTLDCHQRGIDNVAGIEFLRNLQYLDISNNNVFELDVSKNTELTMLIANNVYDLITLDLTCNLKLSHLDIENSNLNNLDITANIDLLYLNVNGVYRITSLDLSNNKKLEFAYINGTSIDSLDLNENIKLKELAYSADWYGQKTLGSLSLENNLELTYLDLNNQAISSIDLKNNRKLTHLFLQGNDLTSIDLSNNLLLSHIELQDNMLSELNMSGLVYLTQLNASNNQLTTLDLSSSTALESLNASSNELTTLDLSSSIALESLNLSRNLLVNLTLNASDTLIDLLVSDNQLSALDLVSYDKLERVYADGNSLTNLTFANNTNLEYLEIRSNLLKELELQGALSLTHLFASNNLLNTANFNDSINVQRVLLSNNQLTEINLQQSVNIKDLYIDNNRLSEIDLSNNPLLSYLLLSDNQFSELNVTNNPALRVIEVDDNNLSDIDLSLNPSLYRLYIDNNKLTDINLDANTGLRFLNIRNNPLLAETHAYIDAMTGINIKK